MIIAAVGLDRERRLVEGPGVTAIIGGGDRTRLETQLHARAVTAHGIISIGIAGGLAPGLRAGDWVLADAVVTSDTTIATDQAWTRRLAQHLPQATRGGVLGIDRVAADPAEKAALHRTSGALAVDMESHSAGSVARRHRLPFAVARVICDPAERRLPQAARVALKPDGRVDLGAVLRALLAHPAELPALIRTGRDAARAFGSLRCGQRRLGPGLCGPDLGQAALNTA